MKKYMSMKTLNWLLYEVHRWLGIAVAILMFGWFFSGIAIMYSTPMTQTHRQQLAHAETLEAEAGWLSLGEAWELSAEQRRLESQTRIPKPLLNVESKAAAKMANEATPGIADARLLRIGGDPVWLIEDTRGQRFALSALDASIQHTTEEQAIKIAKHWFTTQGGHQTVALEYLETVENPIILRNQEALRPFHRIAVGDDGHELLISARTGEVLHASSRQDRAFYYAGNWLHLFKPLEALGFGSIRHDVQLWAGLTATIACLTGLIIGWLRWRPGFRGKKTYSEGRTQPYREFWFKWHFWTGLIGGTLALFWAFSGFIDTNPQKWFANGENTQEDVSRFLGQQLPDSARLWKPAADAWGAGRGADIVELAWRRLGDEAVLLAYDRTGRRTPQTASASQPYFSKTAILDAVQRLAGDAKLAQQEILTDYDSYYYPRHHQGLIEKPLPVVAIQLADATGTRLYIDPQDGRLLAKLDQSRRVFRWLYSALHHWDFGWLYYRPLWDVWMLTWVGFGLVLATSSLVIAWRRLKKTFSPKKTLAPRGVVSSQLVTESP